MAKLYFYYSSMNAGKSTILLQSSYNYRERGMQTLILSPELDDRFQVGKVTSRIGIEADALTFTISDNLLKMVLRVSEQDKSPVSWLMRPSFLPSRRSANSVIYATITIYPC